MSEVLTRSLVTSFSTLLPIAALMLFGGETLQDFGFALLVGVASGTYSSVFIASPVLTAWKERDPVYRRRRQIVMEENDGVVPAYASTSGRGAGAGAARPTAGPARKPVGAAAGEGGSGGRSGRGPGRDARPEPGGDGASIGDGAMPSGPADGGERPGDGAPAEAEPKRATTAGRGEQADVGAEADGERSAAAERRARRVAARRARKRHGRP
jgi:SecD/SecF fusion protein